MGLTRDEAERCGLSHLWPDDLAPVPRAKAKGASKYRNVPTVYNGRRYE